MERGLESGMKERLEKADYILKVFDEEGNQRAEYHGKDDLKPRTAAILFLHFRVVKAVLLALLLMLLLEVGKVLAHPL